MQRIRTPDLLHAAPITEPTTDQARVLVAHGLAQRHNAGLSRGNGLRNFVDAFPFEPTLPFSKVSPAGNGAPPSRSPRL